MTDAAPFTEEQRQALSEADTLFFGAGPVGLWTAIQLVHHCKALNKPCSIAIIERQPHYIRDHALWVNPAWFSAYQHPSTNIPGLSDATKPVQIRANALEKCLFDEATRLGISIIRSEAFKAYTDKHLRIKPSRFWRAYDFQRAKETQRQQWMNEILRHCPKATRIIGSDGAHSAVRKHFFKAQPIARRTIRRVVQLSVEIDLGEDADKQLEMSYPTTGVFDFKALGHVDQQLSNGKCRINARFFVDPSTFDKLRRADGALLATSDTPLVSDHLLTHPLLSDRLQRTLRHWVHSIERRLSKALGRPYTIDLSQAKLTTILLEHTWAPQFRQRIQHAHHQADIVLKGDAEWFMPFYSSLNAGMRSGCWLAKALSEDDLTKRQIALEQYEQKMHRSNFWLKVWLFVKNTVLSLLSFLQSSGYGISLRLSDWTYDQTANMHWRSHPKPTIDLQALHDHEQSIKNRYLSQFSAYLNPPQETNIPLSNSQVYNVRTEPKKESLSCPKRPTL